MQEKYRKKLFQMITFVVVFSVSLFIFINWNAIEKFVIQLFK